MGIGAGRKHRRHMGGRLRDRPWRRVRAARLGCPCPDRPPNGSCDLSGHPGPRCLRGLAYRIDDVALARGEWLASAHHYPDDIHPGALPVLPYRRRLGRLRLYGANRKGLSAGLHLRLLHPDAAWKRLGRDHVGRAVELRAGRARNQQAARIVVSGIVSLTCRPSMKTAGLGKNTAIRSFDESREAATGAEAWRRAIV